MCIKAFTALTNICLCLLVFFTSPTLNTDDIQHLTPREAGFVFDQVDTKSSGRVVLGALTNYACARELELNVSTHKLEKKYKKAQKKIRAAEKTLVYQRKHLDVENMVGGLLMKLKLFVGFAQCLVFIPYVFVDIPFPPEFYQIGAYLRVFNADFSSMFSVFGDLFGGLACDFHTGFYNSFLIDFMMFPMVFGGAIMSYGVVRLRRKCYPNLVNYTTESARTRMYTVVFLLTYSVYTGVATKMFRLFKCDPVEGVYYLVADYRIVCYNDEWNVHQMLAIVGIVVYVFGILISIFVLLLYNKKYLHSTSCPENELYKYSIISRMFGSIYSECKW